MIECVNKIDFRSSLTRSAVIKGPFIFCTSIWSCLSKLANCTVDCRNALDKSRWSSEWSELCDQSKPTGAILPLTHLHSYHHHHRLLYDLFLLFLFIDLPFLHYYHHHRLHLVHLRTLFASLLACACLMLNCLVVIFSSHAFLPLNDKAD